MIFFYIAILHICYIMHCYLTVCACVNGKMAHCAWPPSRNKAFTYLYTRRDISSRNHWKVIHFQACFRQDDFYNTLYILTTNLAAVVCVCVCVCVRKI